jgi:hypothetical protein
MSDKAAQISEEYNRNLAEIRGYADLTPEAKARRIAELYEDASRRHQEAVEEMERAKDERVAKAEKALFTYGYPFTASGEEKAQLRALYRGAYDSVHGSLYLLDPGEVREELERLLVRAERTGDEELAQAVYHVAVERGESKVADAYREKRPAEQKKWEEYAEARRIADDRHRVIDRGMMMSLGIPKPPELEGYTGQAASGDLGAAYAAHLTGRDPLA